jgi:hypothetical protein
MQVVWVVSKMNEKHTYHDKIPGWNGNPRSYQHCNCQAVL